LLALAPTHKVEGHPFSIVRNCLVSIFAEFTQFIIILIKIHEYIQEIFKTSSKMTTVIEAGCSKLSIQMEVRNMQFDQ